MRFKEWLGKYFSLSFAIYLLCTSLWFAYEHNWHTCAGYFVAAIAWVVVWIRQEYIESIERIIGERDAP